MSLEPSRHGRLRSRSTLHSVLIGALLAAFGLTLLANNLGWTDLRAVMRQFWPFALVVFGIASLFSERPNSQFWGLVLIVAGLWIYADLRNWINVPFWAVFGPTLLVLIGGAVVWRALSHGPSSPPEAGAGFAGSSLEGTGGEAGVGPGARTSEYISSFAILSGTEHQPSTPFTGANLVAFMGGVKLDLSNAQMKGDTAVVEVFAVMGGIEIYCPRDWEVTSRVVTLLGGSVDKRRPSVSEGPRKHLVVRGVVLMGGIDIKD